MHHCRSPYYARCQPRRLLNLASQCILESFPISTRNKYLYRNNRTCVTRYASSKQYQVYKKHSNKQINPNPVNVTKNTQKSITVLNISYVLQYLNVFSCRVLHVNVLACTSPMLIFCFPSRLSLAFVPFSSPFLMLPLYPPDQHKYLHPRQFRADLIFCLRPPDSHKTSLPEPASRTPPYKLGSADKRHVYTIPAIFIWNKIKKLYATIRHHTFWEPPVSLHISQPLFPPSNHKLNVLSLDLSLSISRT